MTKVAIIGAGPCGLSALRSFELAEKKGDKKGGMTHPRDLCPNTVLIHEQV